METACDEMQRKFLLDLFDLIDEDGVGHIDDDTLGQALERAGVSVDAETLGHMIKVPCTHPSMDCCLLKPASSHGGCVQVADKNKDGQICRDEWYDLVEIMMSQFASDAKDFDSIRSPRSNARAVMRLPGLSGLSGKTSGVHTSINWPTALNEK